LENNLIKRVSLAAESLLEDEALRGDLEDDAAEMLLNWALAKSEVIAKNTAGLDEEAADETMYPRMKGLRRISRDLNRWISGRGEPGELMEKILEQAKVVYGETFVEPNPVHVEKLKRLPKDIEPIILITELTTLLEGEDNGERKEI
jgi:hypothetical protein